MAKIPKNRQDSEMLADMSEETTFEHESDGRPIARPAKSQAAKNEAPKPAAYADFLSPQMVEELGKALLALKVKLYKDGIVDYTIKVSAEADQVVLKAVPVNKPQTQGRIRQG